MSDEIKPLTEEEINKALRRHREDREEYPNAPPTIVCRCSADYDWPCNSIEARALATIRARDERIAELEEYFENACKNFINLSERAGKVEARVAELEREKAEAQVAEVRGVLEKIQAQLPDQPGSARNDECRNRMIEMGHLAIDALAAVRKAREDS